MSWPSLSSRLEAASFRLTLLYAGLFTGALVVLLLAGGFLSMLLIERNLKESVAEALVRLEAIAAEDGMTALMAEVRTLGQGDAEPALFAALQDTAGAVLAGRLAWSPPIDGWQELPAPDDPEDDLLFATSRELGSDRRLVVAIEADPYYDRLELVLLGTTWVVTAALPLALVCGWLISAMVLRRIALITNTAAAIARDGKLDRRVALQGTGDEFDGLAAQLNAMLASIADLTEAQEHVTAGIAHDLRTPLTRLRNRLAAFAASPSTSERQRPEVAAMIAELDGLLAVFEALLRIAQIDSGTRRARFAPVDLSGLVESLAETYRPVATDAGKRLATAIAPNVRTTGDPALLTQMIVNLLENAIAHTPPEARLALELTPEPEGALLSVKDDGPGIPAADKGQVFARFYRADRSRGSTGHGLGLTLVRAIAKLHAIEIALRDNAPGLTVDLRFAAGRA